MNISYADKITGDPGAPGIFTAENANEVKNAVNSKANQDDLAIAIEAFEDGVAAVEAGLAAKEGVWIRQNSSTPTTSATSSLNRYHTHFTAATPVLNLQLHVDHEYPAQFSAAISCNNEMRLVVPVGATINGLLVVGAAEELIIKPASDRTAALLSRDPSTVNVWYLVGGGSGGAAGDLLDQIDEITSTGGAPAAELAAQISVLASQGSVGVDFADAADMWVSEPGVLLVIPELIEEAKTPTVISPAAGLLVVNGALGWNFEATITSDVDFSSFLGITAETRKIYLFASGGAWDVTASGAALTSNFGAGVTIPSGEWGRFLVDRVGGDICCTFGGLVS